MNFSRSASGHASRPASLVWLPRVLLAGIVGAALGTLAGCSGADEPQSSGPLPMQTWSTAGESSSASGTSGTASTTSTTASSTSAGAASGSTDGTSGTTGTTGATTTTEPTATADAGSAAAADASTACVQPTDEGNSVGVGKFCTTSTDCGTNLLCSAAFGAPAGATFCSLICSTDSDCGGDGAICFAGGGAAGGTKACVTAACAPLAATLF
jgi:hypothetical protein